MDAINDENWERAYAVLQTLIDGLKPKDRDSLRNNDLEHINELLENADKPESSSFYRGLIETSASKEDVLARCVRPLYRNVMETLHREDYLEFTVRPRFEKKKKLSVKGIET